MTESKIAETKKDMHEEPLAMSRFTGGNVRIVQFHIGGPEGGKVGVSHEYVGIGPLLVPCTRGEQKALSGDVLVEVIKANPADPTTDLVFLFILPREVAEVFKAELTPDPPVTAAAYQKFLDSRHPVRATKTEVKPVKELSAGQSVGSTATGKSPSKSS